MGFDPVPWMVGGGAEHSPEVGRIVSYTALRGNEGVFGTNDLLVTALPTPGSAVRAAPGACGVLNRATGGSYQTYVGRNITAEDISVAATGASARTDMIVARVEDPFMAGSPWLQPTNPKVGPYIFTRLISNVPSTATTVTQLNLGYSAIPLARINIPANTGTITQAMITDLRDLANPRRERRLLVANPTAEQTGSGSTTWNAWPSPASWAVPVPSWASNVVVSWTINGVRVPRLNTTTAGATAGQTRATLGGASVVTQPANYDFKVEAATGDSRFTIGGGDTRPVPSAVRGTTQTLRLENYRSTGNTVLYSDAGTSVAVDVEFYETTI